MSYYTRAGPRSAVSMPLWAAPLYWTLAFFGWLLIAFLRFLAVAVVYLVIGLLGLCGAVYLTVKHREDPERLTFREYARQIVTEVREGG